MIDVILDIETTGFNRFEDRITAIGVIYANEEKCFINESEEELLKEFWRWCDSLYECPRFIGFNLIPFDFDFIYKRSLKYNITTLKSIRNSMVDLMNVLRFYNYGSDSKGKLEDYAMLMNINGKLTNGLEAIKMWEEKNFDKLKEYCLQDCRITKELYERCAKLKII